MNSFSRIVISGGLLLALAACQGVEGDQGEFKVQIVTDATVTSMTLTELGIPVAGGVPNPSTTYETEELKGIVYWSVNTPASINYALRISHKPNKGEEGEAGFLPYVKGFELPPLTAQKGDQGTDKRYLFYVSGDTFMTLSGRTTIAGTPY